MTPQPSEQPRLDDCKHDQIVRMVLADESHDWQCVGCGSFFVPYQRREPERGVETLLYDVTEAAATMLEADEFASVDERRLIRAVSAARGYFMHADPPEAAAPDPVATPALALGGSPLDRSLIRAAISNAYYECREAGESMETAADRAAHAVMELAPVATCDHTSTGRRTINGPDGRMAGAETFCVACGLVLRPDPVASPAPLDVLALARRSIWNEWYDLPARNHGYLALQIDRTLGIESDWLPRFAKAFPDEYARLEGQPVAEEPA